MSETLKEMMSAYVTGCLDNANLMQFVDYINSGGSVNNDELGELQNVAALIPIILEIENPPASLQNKIFQQIPDNEDNSKIKTRTKKANLREILESKKAESEKKEEPEIKIPENVSFKGTSKTLKPVSTAPKEDHEEIPQPEDSSKDTPFENPLEKEPIDDNDPKEKEVVNQASDEVFAPKTNKAKKEKVTLPRESVTDNPHPHVTVKRSKRQTLVVTPELEQDQAESKSQQNDEQCEESKPFLHSLTAKIITATSILIFVILLIMYFSTKSSLSEKVASLQKEKNVLKTEVKTKNDFISSNLPLIESFNQKDLLVVPLAGTEDKGGYDARILLSPSSRLGILQFIKEPQISTNESLQLWLISKGQSYSVGIFHPHPGKKFYSLNKLPHIPFDEIEMLRMTKEPPSGSEFPSGSTVYFGAFTVK